MTIDDCVDTKKYLTNKNEKPWKTNIRRKESNRQEKTLMF